MLQSLAGLRVVVQWSKYQSTGLYKPKMKNKLAVFFINSMTPNELGGRQKSITL